MLQHQTIAQQRCLRSAFYFFFPERSDEKIEAADGDGSVGGVWEDSVLPLVVVIFHRGLCS